MYVNGKRQNVNSYILFHSFCENCVYLGECASHSAGSLAYISYSRSQIYTQWKGTVLHLNSAQLSSPCSAHRDKKYAFLADRSGLS